MAVLCAKRSGMEQAEAPVSSMSRLSPRLIRLRVWSRSVPSGLACGFVVRPYLLVVRIYHKHARKDGLRRAHEGLSDPLTLKWNAYDSRNAFSLLVYSR